MTKAAKSVRGRPSRSGYAERQPTDHPVIHPSDAVALEDSIARATPKQRNRAKRRRIPAT